MTEEEMRASGMTLPADGFWRSEAMNDFLKERDDD
jgi:hypothetical protein